MAYGTPASTSTAVDVIERASPDITTTNTADPGTSGTTLAVTSAVGFPASGTYKIAVGIGTSQSEIMYVTAGAGTLSWTVARGKDGSTPTPGTGVAHAIGQTVSLIVGVQRVESVYATKQITNQGRVATFRTPGRAGTAGQKAFAIHNASGSPVIVDVQKIAVDVVQTVTKALTVLPPIVRLWKFTAVPTNGTNLTKVPVDSTMTSSSSVTVWGDASADGTGSATTLTVTLPGGTIVSEEFAPRWVTAVGYEPFDRTTYLENTDEVVTLNALEGVAIFLDYTVATANPTTDSWVVSAYWVEYAVA